MTQMGCHQGCTTRRDARQKVVKETKSRRPAELAAGLARPAQRHKPGEARLVADELPGLPGIEEGRARAFAAERVQRAQCRASVASVGGNRARLRASEASAGSVGAKRAKRA